MKRCLSAWLVIALAGPASAQDRIGYANLDLILTRMPESQDVGRQLDAFQDELAKALETKQAYARQKLVEAREAEAAGVVSQDRLAEYESELKRLEREIRETALESDQKLLQKRGELMEPVVGKLQETIQTVAEAEGYTHVLNTVDGTGTSVLLWGVEERDLTERILAALGVSETPK